MSVFINYFRGNDRSLTCRKTKKNCISPHKVHCSGKCINLQMQFNLKCLKVAIVLLVLYMFQVFVTEKVFLVVLPQLVIFWCKAHILIDYLVLFCWVFNLTSITLEDIGQIFSLNYEPCVKGNNDFSGQCWGVWVLAVTCLLYSAAVYSAVGSLPPVEGQKQQVTKYFISQVKHASPRQLQKRNRSQWWMCNQAD